MAAGGGGEMADSGLPRVLVHYTRSIGLSSHTPRFLEAQLVNIGSIADRVRIPEALVARKPAELLSDFGRRAIYERDMRAARHYLQRSLALRTTAGAGLSFLATYAPLSLFDLRRRVVDVLRDEPPPRPIDTAGMVIRHGDTTIDLGRYDDGSLLWPASTHETRIDRALDRPVVITTVDAEEDFNWDRPFSRDSTAVLSIRSQHLAHRVFDRHGVRQTYTVDYPVAAQDAGRAPLRELLARGLCHIGTQLHSWVTPPFDEVVSTANSFPGALPVALEYAKLATLTHEIERAFGVTPRLCRAGRYGLGPHSAAILRALGYRVDSSIMPRWSFADEGGRDFRHLSADPFWVGGTRTLLALPISAALVGRAASLPLLPATRLFRPTSKRARLPSIAARLGLVERIKLTPEGISITEAKRLARHMASAGHRVFVLTYHSPSLEPGNTPYVRDLADRDRLLDWLDEFYTFCQEGTGGGPVTWQEVYARLGGAPGD